MKNKDIIGFFGLMRSQQKSKTVTALEDFINLKEEFRRNCKRRRCRKAAKTVKKLNQIISHFNLLEDYPILKEFESRIYEQDVNLLNKFNVALDAVEEYLEEYSKFHY